MKWFVLQMMILLLSIAASAVETDKLVTRPAGLKILNKKCIRLGTSEVLPIQFKTVCTVLSNSNLLYAVQDEFGRSVSKTGQVDFPIIKKGDGEYYYINEKGQRTDIVELYRKQTDAFSYDYIAMARGKRFFGEYHVIIHLQVVDAGPSGIVYSVKAHIWLHNWLARSSHKVGLTRSFLRNKMRLISWVAREISTGLCEQEEVKASLVETKTTASPCSDSHEPDH